MTATLGDAIAIAATAHREQTDKRGRAYIFHALDVMNAIHRHLYRDEREYETLQIIAVLHDVVEDSDITLDDLREAGFSPTVVDAVDAITRRKDEETYEAYIERLAENSLAVVVKRHDLALNLNGLIRLDGETQKRLYPRYTNAMKRLKEVR